MAKRTVRKVTKVDSQIPKMKDVDYRINKTDSLEQIRKKSKNRKKKEQTLNELSDEIIEMFENVEFSGPGASIMADEPLLNRMTNQPRPPSLTASRGDNLRANQDAISNMTSGRRADDINKSKNILSDPDDFELEEEYQDDDQDPAFVPRGANYEGGDSSDKYISDYRGDGLDYGATHSESFTGTAAIALAPAAFGANTREPKKKKTKLEKAMRPKRVVREYTPDFAAGEYKPGESKMNKIGGKGVQGDSLGSVGKSHYKAELSDASRGRKANAAMGLVGRNQQAGRQAKHDSSVADPDDNIQRPVGHDWPKKPKNFGGTAPMKGNRYNDGGQLGHVSEHWSPDLISSIMEQEVDIQTLFNRYAQSVNKVTQEGFHSLCEAYGHPYKVDKETLLKLMAVNPNYVFYEDQDSDGDFWAPEPVNQSEDFDFDEYDDEPEHTDGMLSDEEHEDLHEKIKAFCEKYGCPEEELHDLCHAYAQMPMDEHDEEDFGDMDDDAEDEMDDDDNMADDDDMEESAMQESWGEESEGVESESWGEDSEGVDNECWGEDGEGVDNECWDEEADVCPDCNCKNCKCARRDHQRG